ncbi:MAG TPA: DUF2252 domain-containing protein [Ktedonobacteraceae bacterium]|nr:DUF2252 domain-containing protein [Ktedonobacteraceae bacterium]
MTTSISFVDGMSNDATRAERYAAGKALRAKAPRTSHGEWTPAADRPDPISLLEESNRTRVPELVPIRYGRMSLSPFAFLRGSAGVMASDLANTPVSGIKVQICGDAHLSNFGFFATPERNLVFDVNDFDETLPGPWEWDVKRLAASIVVAGRQNGYTTQENRQAVVRSMREYHTLMQQMASMCALDVWYQHIDIGEIMGMVKRKEQERLQREEKKASGRTNLGAFPKMVEKVDGVFRIKDEPPLIVHVEDQGDAKKTEAHEAEWIKGYFAAYMETLPDDRRVLLNKYHFVDFARKVVGVGSVGTRTWIGLFMSGGDGDDPLFLQVKEADASVIGPYAGYSPYANHGERVVQGQRLMQEASDIFLGWTHGDVADLYVRQLRDMKLSEDIATMTKKEFEQYARWCAMALARAHARSGDPAQISGYLGGSATFEQAVALFAEAYADQTERDHAALLAAVKEGRIQAEVDV